METADFELEAGQMVGEYRVERKLGEGAFGKVYAALQPLIGKAVAIKILKPDKATTKEMVDRFAAEARAVNQIKNRHIIDIFSFGTLPNGVHYFVMELLEGMTFQSYLRKNGPIDAAMALTILWPVARALSAAHKKGIAHRDLKPENVFLSLDQDGGMFPKLMDFGIAKLMTETDGTHKTQAGMLLGTPVYMSPEQCRATTVDHRADIYSFGIMLHEAMTGSRPFDADNLMDVIMRQISDPAPKMSVCRPGIPPALDAPVLHMLEKSPAKRPESILAALDGFAEAARSVGIQVPASTSQGAGGGAPVSGAGAGAGSAPVHPPVSGAVSASVSGAGAPPVAGTTTGTGTVVTSSAAVAASSAAAVPSLIAGPPSVGAPYSGPPSYSGPPPGGASHAGPPSHPLGVQPAPAGGMGPVSRQAPSAPKSSWPVILGAVGGLFALFLVGLYVLGSGDEGSGQPSGEPARAGGSASGAASAASSSGASAIATTVQIGAAPPRTGRIFERESETFLEVDTFKSGVAKPVHTWSQKDRSKLKITILTASEWNATRVEIQYLDSFAVAREDKQAAEKTVSTTAGRSFFVAARDSGPSVSAVDGKEVTEDESAEVLRDAGELLKSRPEVFRRALAPGDSLSLPPAIAGHLLGFSDEDPDVVMRAETTVLRLASVDRERGVAVFDVDLAYFSEYKQWKWTFTAPMKGTLAFDIPTGLPIGVKLAGPVSGFTTENGGKQPLKGTLSFDVKAQVTP